MRELAETRAFLDRLWKYEGVFNPDLQCTYADRARRRQPGDKTLGLSPHMDAGTVERWIDPGYQKVYAHDFRRGLARVRPVRRHAPAADAGDSFAGGVQHVPHLSGLDCADPPGAADGTLRLIPIAEGIAYVLLRALQDDVDEADLCGAAPGRALGVSPEWHPELTAALVSIPEVMPGDTVFWHTDICHAVGDEHARPASTPASSTSDRRPTARRIAPIFPSSGRRFCRGVRRLTLPRWTSKSTSRGERRLRI